MGESQALPCARVEGEKQAAEAQRPALSPLAPDHPELVYNVRKAGGPTGTPSLPHPRIQQPSMLALLPLGLSPPWPQPTRPSLPGSLHGSLRSSFLADWAVSPAQTPSVAQVAFSSISTVTLLYLFARLSPHYPRLMGPSNSPPCLCLCCPLFLTRPNHIFLLDLTQTSPPPGSVP